MEAAVSEIAGWVLKRSVFGKWAEQQLTLHVLLRQRTARDNAEKRIRYQCLKIVAKWQILVRQLIHLVVVDWEVQTAQCSVSRLDIQTVSELMLDGKVPLSRIPVAFKLARSSKTTAQQYALVV